MIIYHYKAIYLLYLLNISQCFKNWFGYGSLYEENSVHFHLFDFNGLFFTIGELLSGHIEVFGSSSASDADLVEEVGPHLHLAVSKCQIRLLDLDWLSLPCSWPFVEALFSYQRKHKCLILRTVFVANSFCEASK